MEHTHTEQHEGGGTKEIWRVTVILSILTVVELGLGFWMMGMPLESSLRLAVKGARSSAGIVHLVYHRIFI